MYSAVLLLVLGAEPGWSSPIAPPPVRRYHEVNADLRAALRREALAMTKTERAAAIYDLTQLYQELRRDPRLADSETLTEYKNRLWSRLVRAKREIERELAREPRLGSDPSADGPATQEDAGLVDAVCVGLAESLHLTGQLAGGPAQLLTQLRGAAGGAAIPDYGPALVDLIERTIAPGFWDTQGGPGTIVYYAPLRVLVVRATSEVHHDLGGVLGGLRAAGK